MHIRDDMAAARQLLMFGFIRALCYFFILVDDVNLTREIFFHDYYIKEHFANFGNV